MSHWRNARGCQGIKREPLCYGNIYRKCNLLDMYATAYTDDFMPITRHLSLTLFVTIIMSARLCPVVSHVLADTVEILKNQMSQIFQIKCWGFDRFLVLFEVILGLYRVLTNHNRMTNYLSDNSDLENPAQCDAITFTIFRSQPWSIYSVNDSIPLSVGYRDLFSSIYLVMWFRF